MDQSTPTPGRGAALFRAFQRKALAEAAELTPPGPSVDKVTNVPKPRGRAALLEKCYERQVGSITKNVGSDSSVDTKSSTREEDISKPLTTQLLDLDVSKPDDPVKYIGSSGIPVNTTCNYIKLDVERDRGIFEYEVIFKPTVDSKNVKFLLIRSINAIIGDVKQFDGGAMLYLPHKLPELRTETSAAHPNDQTSVAISIIFKKQKLLKDCINLYNTLFRKIMHILLYSQIGRNFFDGKNSFLIPQHKLEVLPGFVVVVDEYEGGVMLCLDTQHKVLRTETALDFIKNIQCINKDRPQLAKKEIDEYLIGQSVLTRYNNKLYRVDEIMWDTNPQCSFETSKGDAIMYHEYYKKQYNLDIRDLTQPLLLNNQSIRVNGQLEKVDRQLCLVPELCSMTGLTDSMVNNFTLMKDVAQYTRVTPNQRWNALRKYTENLMNSPEAQKVLSNWGLKLNNATIDLKARILDKETIYFGDGVSVPGNSNADWNNVCCKQKVLSAVDLQDWAVLYTLNGKRQAFEFIEMTKKLGSPMGIHVNSPSVHMISNDRNESWLEGARKIITDSLQIIVFICSTSRNDRYAAIKKLCCTQYPIASQVINVRTLNNQGKIRGIVQKILLQINCKLGGSLWTIRLPIKNWMICGIDVFHNKSSNSSVCAFVSSLNNTLSNWYTNVIKQGGEISDHLKSLFIKALEKYREKNGQFPTHVIIFRDGIGDGQMGHCLNYEVPQYESTLKNMKLVDLKISVVIVQKRINTRIILKAPEENPPPGTIVDHTILRKQYKDFFLVSQNVRQGTVTPTHYVVIHDGNDIPADRMQRLTYKMCHMYYNWPGTVRVPAPCQYAHKLAYLVGKHINRIPDERLSERLYYL